MIRTEESYKYVHEMGITAIELDVLILALKGSKCKGKDIYSQTHKKLLDRFEKIFDGFVEYGLMDAQKMMTP